MTLSTQCPSPRPPPNALPLSPVPPVTYISRGLKVIMVEDKGQPEVGVASSKASNGRNLEVKNYMIGPASTSRAFPSNVIF